MRYRFIQAEKAAYPVEVLCRVLTVAQAITPGAVVRSGCARSRITGCSHRFAPVTRPREAAMGVRGFITICAPTGFRLAAIASLGSCGSRGSAVSDDRGAGANQSAHSRR